MLSQMSGYFSARNATNKGHFIVYAKRFRQFTQVRLIIRVPATNDGQFNLSPIPTLIELAESLNGCMDTFIL